ncbi:RNA polymerase sigma-70 region 2 domain-containing protein [uncultured Gammaproteobacteria bacterium]
MDTHNSYDGLDPRAIRTVRYYARRLARLGALPGMETEDYEQELMLDLYRRLRNFDAKRGSLATFVELVVRNRAAVLAIGRRCVPVIVSLNQPLNDSKDNETLGDRLDENCALWRNPSPFADDMSGLRIDMARFVLALPPNLQRCCGWLIIGSIQEAARESGVHRDTIFNARHQVRERAIHAGFGIFFAVPLRRFSKAAGI